MCLFVFFSSKKKRKRKRKEGKRNQHRPRRLSPWFAVLDTRLPEHAVRSSVTVLCLSVSLQGQLANDDADDEEEDAQRQDAGAQALFSHGRAHQGGGVRGGHGGHLSLPQSVVLLENKEIKRMEQLSLLSDACNNRISCDASAALQCILT